MLRGFLQAETDAGSGRLGAEPGAGRLQRDQLWTILSAAAVLALVARLHAHFGLIAAGPYHLAFLGTVAYLAVLACGVVVIAARTDLQHRAADLLVLAVAVGIRVIELPALGSSAVTKKLTDEGVLTNAAIRSVLNGHDPYAISYQSLMNTRATHMMDGSLVAHYDYPPLPFLLGIPGHLVGLHTITALDGVALIAAAILGYVVLPTRLKPVAVLAVLSLGFLDTRAQIGEPVVIALPLLLAATMRWYAVGDPGRRRADLIAGACLGLAMATQQLVWFVVPFLGVAIWARHHGRVDALTAARRLLPYAGAAAATFAVINLPFALVHPASWWNGLTEVFTQHATPYGPGLWTWTIDSLQGSGNLGYFPKAAFLMYAALLVLSALFPRRLSPAFALLPMIVFLFSVRSQDTYYLCFAPLWILLLATTPPGVTDGSRGILRLNASPRAIRLGIVPALLAPAAIAVGLGLLTPAPMTATATVSPPSRRVEVIVHNTSGAPIAPHFTVMDRAQLGSLWRTVSGPADVAPGHTARYVVAAPRSAKIRLLRTRHLAAVTDHPETISVIPVH